MIGPAGFMAAPKQEPVHNGDLAEYQGSVKALAGCRCEVIDRLQRVCIQVRLADGRLVMRWVKPENLKRLGGGVIDHDY